MSHASDEKHFVFAQGGLQYELPVMQVLEIVETPTIQPAHGTLPGCIGNVSHREHLLPVFDPTALSSGRPSSLPFKTMVIVRNGGAVFGLAMERFVAVITFDETILAAGVGATAVGDNPLVEAVRALRGNALISLSTDAIAGLVRRSLGNQKLMDEGVRVASGSPEATTAAEGRILLCARIEQALFGIPVEHVIEVIKGYDVTPLFQMPPIIRGLINLRGQVLACIDISDDLGFPPRRLEEHNQYIVLKSEDAELALCVDKVTGIRRLSSERLQKADLVLSGEMTRYTGGVHEVEEGSLFVLSVAAIFEAPQLEPYRRSEA